MSRATTGRGEQCRSAHLWLSVKEDTLDWHAQDVDGNIWYLGEDTKEYENGVVVSSEGSWEAGVDGAQAGIVRENVEDGQIDLISY